LVGCFVSGCVSGIGFHGEKLGCDDCEKLDGVGREAKGLVFHNLDSWQKYRLEQ
jgi:hypothetical protein